MGLEKLYRFPLIALLLLAEAGFAQQPRLVVPVGHTDGILEAQFSPNGKSIATASFDQTIKIWDVATGRLLQTLYGHKATITTLSFSHGGRYLLSGSAEDSSTRLWNTETGKEIFQLKRTGYMKEQAWLSPDEKKLFALDGKGITMWDVLTARQIGGFNTGNERGDGSSIQAVAASHDGKELAVMMGYYDSILIWNIQSQQLVKKLGVHNEIYGFKEISFSPDDKLIYIFSSGNFNGIDIASGKRKFSIDYSSELMEPLLSKEGRYFYVAGQYKPYSIIGNDTVQNNSGESNIYQPAITDLQTGVTKLLKGDGPTEGRIRAVCFDKAGTLLVVVKADGVFIFKIQAGKLIRQTVFSSTTSEDYYFNHVSISADGKNILLSNQDIVSVFNREGKFLYSLKGKILYDDKQYFSAKADYIFTSTGNQKGFSWDILNGKISTVYDTSKRDDSKAEERRKAEQRVNDSINYKNRKFGENDSLAWTMDMKNYIFNELSPLGNYVVTWQGHDSLGKVWDRASGKLLHQIRSEYGDFTSVKISSDDRFVVFLNNNQTNQLNQMWDNLERELKGDTTIMPVSGKYPNEAKVLDISTGQLVLDMQDTSGLDYFRGPAFSADSKYFSFPGGIVFSIWDVSSWKKILTVANPCSYDQPYETVVSPDGKKIILICVNTAYLYEALSGKLLFILPGAVKSAKFNMDGKYILTQSEDRQVNIYTTDVGQLLYTFYAFEDGNYIVTDKFNRYDGTAETRKDLYYVCGTEFIDLDQFKDQLWVPNLAERIMNGDSINAPRLTDLNICGLTPQVEEKKQLPGIYQFIIKPRRGGLGETVLFINGIEVKRYKPVDLKKIGSIYELVVSKKEISSFLVSGKENQVAVKSYTSGNTLSSRGLVIRDTALANNTTTPNLYAVMVGISDYKGDELDLKYAAKDASDLSGVISNAAKKLLNTEPGEHVFVYNLTTNADRYQLPEKNSIKKVLEEIGKKATANDILVIFFAGHGVMEGEKKQFYFLTADASKSSAVATIADVGISTAELTEWMKPQNIKAQKRVLIFDACNSGQAINDFVKLGNVNQGYMAARNDEKGQQIKAIEKLNEQSGLFILSASASNQNAYEMSRYSQGLLTYSLLKAIKQQPDILQDGKYLDVSRWFGAAEKTVGELTKENGARQQPQVVSNTNFNIGLVDEEVTAKIILPQEKPLFTNSNLQNNDDNIAMDDLELNRLLDNQFSVIAARGSSGVISFVASLKSSDVYALGGRYEVKEKSIIARINIRLGKEIKYRFELTGHIDHLNELAIAIAEKAASLVK